MLIMWLIDKFLSFSLLIVVSIWTFIQSKFRWYSNSCFMHVTLQFKFLSCNANELSLLLG